MESFNSLLQLARSLMRWALYLQIGNLTFLRTIDLGNNSFHDEIPQELGKLFRLQYLLLLNNSFQGEFPANLTHCSHLRVILVHYNNLRGKIPTELGSLSNLSFLNLAVNHFTGTIPFSIGNLSNLRVLCPSYNNLEGSIPTQLGQLSKLEALQLTANNLTGMVHTSLYNISSIYFFSIVANQLHGILPLDLGLTLPNLQEFYVFSNQFYGQIPSSIANATRLVQIDFGSNSFTGPMPMNLGTLDALEDLATSGNSLGTNQGNELMSFLTSLSSCSNLRILDLATNHFKGLLPHSIANLSTKITWFALEDNYISGNIPFGIGNLVNLRYLFLSQNLLTGSIPNSIGKLSMLEKLLVQYNNISREIPSSIRNLSRLGALDLSTNMIEGSISISLGNCTNLQQIYLDYNHLTGAIPYQIFGLASLFNLSLSQNYLTGLLPQEVGNFKNLGGLYVSKNKLFGEIPTTLGNCEVLEFLYIDGNLFEGTIPTAFRQLKGIQELDVSRNNLSGQIPRFLGEFRFFQYLNLSYNMFDGEVPNGGVSQTLVPSQLLEIVSYAEELNYCNCLHARWKPRSRQQVNLASLLQNKYPQLSYGELFQATNGFSPSNLIGEGGYGSVYKGILNSDEQIIAVKVLKLHERGANKSFVTKCEALKNIRHQNLVKIITACSSIDFKGNDFKALVFKFMENGSLENWVHPNIAIDVACALDYFHHHCEMAFIHCDLKPSNILLDGDLCAHVSDFGLAKIFSATNGISIHQQSSSIGIRGTIGYVAPEYGMGEEVSTQDINDPEHPYFLEELKVMSEDAIEVDDKHNCVRVTFTPTVEHCSMATVIGLCLQVKLKCSLPMRYKCGYQGSTWNSC
ncbi:unnamed protein product [Camellia sinensis]